MKQVKCELFCDNFQNYKRYGIPKAQLVIADIPYNIGADAYGSNPMWYVGGDNKNGESAKAKSSFFRTDGYFKIAEYMHFCNRLLKKEPKLHPTQKPVKLLKKLIEIFTDPGDTVIDPCAGSGSTLRAARELGRNSYGFELDKQFYRLAKDEMLKEPETVQIGLEGVV